MGRWSLARAPPETSMSEEESRAAPGWGFVPGAAYDQAR
jgi:hypothetical protein